MSESTTNQVSYLHITELQAEQRIDNFLLKQLKGVPKSHIYRILRKGEVRVNKGRAKPEYKLQIGDLVRIPPIQLGTPTEKSATPPDVLRVLADAILHEDAHLLVLNKPSGMAVHGGSGISFGVIEGLRALYPKMPYLELVHRLDRDTSGCLLLAKKPSVLKQLHQLLRDNQITKQYQALMQGAWESGLTRINVPLRKNILQSGERIVRVDAAGKPAISHFAFVESFAGASLVRVKLETGRTHQIRVHAAHTGHPLAGDSKYGNEAFNRQMRECGLKRLFLHAESLRIPALDQQAAKYFSAPLPLELETVLDRLRKPSGAG